MENYTLSLALFDYVPVFLSGIGLYFITKWITSRRADLATMAAVGSVLIFLGGFFKATWKLIWVLAQVDINILEHSLFVLLGSGFIVLACALGKSLKENAAASWNLPLSLLALALLLTVGANMGQINVTIVGIVITTLGNAYFSIRLTAHCFSRKEYLPAALILGNFILILFQGAIARTEGHTVDQQWLAEINNTAAQGVFALGAWLIHRRNI